MRQVLVVRTKEYETVLNTTAPAYEEARASTRVVDFVLAVQVVYSALRIK